VGEWWRGGWFWSEAWGRHSSGCRRLLVHHGGIIGVILKLRIWWAPNVETK
jgi:hypothetical protein